MPQVLCIRHWINTNGGYIPGKKRPKDENVKGNCGCWTSCQVQGAEELWGYGSDEEVETEQNRRDELDHWGLATHSIKCLFVLKAARQCQKTSSEKMTGSHAYLSKA